MELDTLVCGRVTRENLYVARFTSERILLRLFTFMTSVILAIAMSTKQQTKYVAGRCVAPKHKHTRLYSYSPLWFASTPQKAKIQLVNIIWCPIAKRAFMGEFDSA